MSPNNVDRIARILAPALAAGQHEKIQRNMDTVVENIYRRLPSGDYGRGDVRAAILAILAR
jgi:hypothetical protein